MTTIFFKFPDEAEAIKALSQFRGKDENGKDMWIMSSHEHALDIVGTIYKPTGKILDGEYGPVEEMAPVPGFHVNFIGALPKGTEAFVVVPAMPSRVFAT